LRSLNPMTTRDNMEKPLPMGLTVPLGRFRVIYLS
jgi:hypothetical protein